MDGLREFRRRASQAFMPLVITGGGRDPFWGRLQTVTVDEVHLSRISAAPHRVDRTPDTIVAGDAGSFKASLVIDGTGLLVQDGRETLLRSGELAIYDTDRPYSLAFADDVDMLVMMFRRDRLGLPIDPMERLTARRFSPEESVGSMVIPFLWRLADRFDTLEGAAGLRLVRCALDLLTTMLSDELDRDAQAGDRHLQLMQRIHRFIEVHLADPDLGPASIAGAQFISTRHLHALFREQGTTVSAWIRRLRLERCRHDLLDPIKDVLPIGAIAARWGLFDAPHFSRTFKAVYGMSPRECRRRDAA